MSCSTDYSTLLDLFIRLVQSQAEKKIEPGEEWLNDAQTLSVKLFRHLVSMQTIAAGATVEQNKIPTIFFVDHASVKVVARAALETYLVFFYLYGSADRATSEFRHKTWRLAGLVDRQLFHVSTDEHREALANEKQQIDALKAEIEKAPQLQAYTLKQRAKLLEGDWRVGNSWSDLSLQAGFYEKYFKDIYGYLCGYSHSSYLSALQTGQAQTIEDQQMLTQAILSIGVFIMAHFAFSYSSAFVSASAVLAANSGAKRVAEKWQFGPEDMAAVYDR
jgi:AraC-like DNA-binding protein